MDDVKRVPSSEFRVTYVRATEPIAVTVLGRVIGHWVPINTSIDARFTEGIRPGEPASNSPSGAAVVAAVRSTPQAVTDASSDPSAHPGTSARGMTQAERDKVLRKVAGK